MKKILKKILTVILAVCMLTVFAVPALAEGGSSGFKYIHDPMQNPRAAVDIIADPACVYGFRPNPDSTRLGSYAVYDFTDEAVVAGMRAQRVAYHESMKELYDIIDSMKAAEKSVEEIAAAVSTRRNELRLETYKDNPEGLAEVKASNLATYGDENGPTLEFLYNKYGSWETVIEKALSSNPGADACLGLYDEYYNTYFIEEKSKSGTVVYYNGRWVYIGENEYPDYSFTGLAPNDWGWWRVEGGVVNFKAEGLYPNDWGWWYVKGGYVRFDFTGIAANDWGSWYVKNGYVDFSYSGTFVQENTVYTVTRGMVTGREFNFSYWVEGAPSLATLKDFVESVTDDTSADYIPEADRIAVFDMDGTFYGELFPHYLEYLMLEYRVLEDPDFEADEEMIEAGLIIREHKYDHQYPSGFEMTHARQAARAYAGMTVQEFEEYVRNFMKMEADGFEGLTYGEAIYKPMKNVFDYLHDNGFVTYIVSGSDRYICRTLACDYLGIPYDNVIGMDVRLDASKEGDTPGVNYVFKPGEDVIRSDELLVKNLKFNKVSGIVREIGKQPVLGFGNSSGDVSMLNYVISGNKYRSAAFMLIADDETRDYGNTAKAQSLKEEWISYGYTVISMKDDFATIYGENVRKTEFTELSAAA